MSDLSVPLAIIAVGILGIAALIGSYYQQHDCSKEDYTSKIVFFSSHQIKYYLYNQECRSEYYPITPREWEESELPRR